jgi:hypothetical protein
MDFVILKCGNLFLRKLDKKLFANASFSPIQRQISVIDYGGVLGLIFEDVRVVICKYYLNILCKNLELTYIAVIGSWTLDRKLISVIRKQPSSYPQSLTFL